MNKNDWYNTESWYDPLRQEPELVSASIQKPQKKTGWKRWQGGIALALVALLLVSSSLLFGGRGGGEKPGNAPKAKSDKLPDDWTDFFDQYYTDVETDVAEINISQSELYPGFELKLEKAEGEPMDLKQLYEHCVESVVAITGYNSGATGYYWGTGVILSEDGLILTNTHVIAECDRVTVALYDDSSYEATLVGADTISDIAVLKIEASGLPVATFGESGTLSVGDHVAAIGNPLGQTFRSTLTDGIISAIERGISYNGHSMTLLQTNTAINEGNSGGALYNMYGQVIGITNMKMMSTYSSIEGIGFAIPSATVRTVVNSLVRSGEMRGRPAIGITVGEIPKDAGNNYKEIPPEGLYVSSVTEGTDAAAKGIQHRDIITEANHTPVKTTEDISKIKDQLQVGDTIVFTIWRNGEIMEIEVVLMDLNDVYGG